MEPIADALEVPTKEDVFIFIEPKDRTRWLYSQIEYESVVMGVMVMEAGSYRDGQSEDVWRYNWIFNTNSC